MKLRAGVVLLTLCVLVSSTRVAVAQSDLASVPDVKTIRANIEAATGKELDNVREERAFHSEGMDGTSVELTLGKDYKQTTVTGPLSTAGGSLDGRIWQQDENGQVYDVLQESGEVPKDPTVTTASRVSHPFDAFVLTTVNLRGEGRKEYVDPATWHIVRVDRLSTTGTATTLYDDFRTVGGRTEAWHWVTRDAHSENDGEGHITSMQPGVVTRDQLAVPSSRPDFMVFPPGKTTVELPVQKQRTELIVRVKIGNRGLDFLLDSGASGIFMDEAVASQLGLKFLKSSSMVLSAERFNLHSVIVPEMTVGELRMHDVYVTTASQLPDDEAGNYKVVGLLGFDFIDALALRLNYEAGTVTAMNPSTFVPPSEPNTFGLTVRLGDGIPMTDVLVNGVLGERFILDTGDQAGSTIFDYFVRRNPKELGNLLGPALEDASSRAVGAGGVFERREFKTQRVDIGPINVDGMNMYLTTSSGSYAQSIDGLIGTDILQCFTLLMDYSDSKVYLIPNKLCR